MCQLCECPGAEEVCLGVALFWPDLLQHTDEGQPLSAVPAIPFFFGVICDGEASKVVLVKGILLHDVVAVRRPHPLSLNYKSQLHSQSWDEVTLSAWLLPPIHQSIFSSPSSTSERICPTSSSSSSVVT